MPAFDTAVTSYTANTTDATNKITVAAIHPKAVISILVNGIPHVNGTAATWLVGKNAVTIHVAHGTTHKTYTIIVTKAGTLGALTVASVAGTELGFTAITVTEPLTAGCVYKYKTAASVDLPTLDDDLKLWNNWDGEDEIESTTGHDIVIAEVCAVNNLVKAAGKATVAAKTEE